MARTTTAQRFAQHVNLAGPLSLRREAPGHCHLWTGTPTAKGYGRFWLNGRNIRAHHYAYVQAHGPIPAGHEIDHLCRNRLCVNPAHLEAVTHRVNVLRSSNVAAIRAAQTHCCRGHHLAGSNLRIRPNGTRQCIACARYRRTTRPAERTAA
jgi:hypothetical protein